MKIKLDKKITITALILLSVIHVIGLPIFLATYGLSILKFPFPMWTILNLKIIIIGFGLFYFAKITNHDKLTWLLLGLVYKEYAIILFTITILFENHSRDFFKSLHRVLLLLILPFVLGFLYEPILIPYFQSKFERIEYAFVEYEIYYSIATYVLAILMNLILALKLNRWIKKSKMNNSTEWAISTIFLGLLTVILFNIVSEREKINAA